MVPNSSIFSKIPFLRFSLAFILGNIISEYIECKYSILLLVLITVGLVLIKIIEKFGQNHFSNKIFGFSSIIIFITIGFLYSTNYKNHLFSDQMPLKAVYTGTALTKDITTNNRVKYEIKIRTASHKDSLFKCNEKILLYSSDSITNKNIYPGCNILFDAKLFPIRNNNNPGEFKYAKFMKNKGIRYQCYGYNKIEILSSNSNSLKTRALKLRSKLLETYQQAGIPQKEFAVLAALTLGDKSFLDDDLKSKFTSTGAMHVLAVSGLHVGILYFVLNFFLGFTRKNKYTRILKVIILIISLWGFAFITGLSPSVMRASTMFTFIVIGENLKRKTNIYNTLSLSAFILILINPLIINEIGFQLSYAAVTSIVFLQPKISNLLKTNNKILKYLWGLLSVSVAAQLGTFPISIFYFHQFPVYFWLSNFIVIPAAAVLIYLAIGFFMLQTIPFLSSIFTWALISSTQLMNKGIELIDQLPFAVIENIWIDKITMLFLIILVVLMAIISIAPKFRILLTTIVFLILLVGNAIKNSLQINQQSIIVFYNTYNNNLVSFINGTEHYYYSDNSNNSEFIKNLINNSSGKLHTSSAVLLDSNTNTVLLKKINMHILFKDICISINENPDNEHSNNPDIDLIWHPDKSEIIIKNHEKFKFRTYKKGKLKPFSSLANDSTINIRDSGALLLFTNK